VSLALVGSELPSSQPLGNLRPLANVDWASIAAKDGCPAKLIRNLPGRQGCGASWWAPPL